MANKGKEFERQFQKCAKTQNILIVRLNDTSLSWSPTQTSRFQCENPCDFIVYQKPNIFFLELKSTQYSSISIQTEPEETAMIKLHQINSLVQLSQAEGSYAGFVFNFRQKNSLEEITYFMRIQDFSTFLVEREKKSINKTDIVDYGGIIIPQKLIRTKYNYNIQEMINLINKHYGEDLIF